MRTKKDFDKQNEYNKAKYDRYSLMLPKGQKAIIQEYADKQGIKLNTLINNAITQYIQSLEETPAEDKPKDT